LKKVADECGATKIDKLTWRYGEVDETLSHLAWAMLLALDRPESANRFFIDHIVLALNTHFATAYGGMQSSSRIACGGLAPWQELRSKELMTSRIASPISLKEVANACRLSSSHFARAFRKTTGESPHRWLIKRRVETAKDMLVSTESTLCEIAIACGFADQSHLSRVFANIVGTTPGSWRRERKN
jgi:AraC-like DNA-binding protein